MQHSHNKTHADMITFICTYRLKHKMQQNMKKRDAEVHICNNNEEGKIILHSL